MAVTRAPLKKPEIAAAFNAAVVDFRAKALTGAPASHPQSLINPQGKFEESLIFTQIQALAQNFKTVSDSPEASSLTRADMIEVKNAVKVLQENLAQKIATEHQSWLNDKSFDAARWNALFEEAEVKAALDVLKDKTKVPSATGQDAMQKIIIALQNIQNETVYQEMERLRKSIENQKESLSSTRTATNAAAPYQPASPSATNADKITQFKASVNPRKVWKQLPNYNGGVPNSNDLAASSASNELKGYCKRDGSNFILNFQENGTVTSSLNKDPEPQIKSAIKLGIDTAVTSTLLLTSPVTAPLAIVGMGLAYAVNAGINALFNKKNELTMGGMAESFGKFIIPKHFSRFEQPYSFKEDISERIEAIGYRNSLKGKPDQPMNYDYPGLQTLTSRHVNRMITTIGEARNLLNAKRAGGDNFCADVKIDPHMIQMMHEADPSVFAYADMQGIKQMKGESKRDAILRDFASYNNEWAEYAQQRDNAVISKPTSVAASAPDESPESSMTRPDDDLGNSGIETTINDIDVSVNSDDDIGHDAGIREDSTRDDPASIYGVGSILNKSKTELAAEQNPAKDAFDDISPSAPNDPPKPSGPRG